MTKLFDLFPIELQDQVMQSKLTGFKSNKPNKPNKSKNLSPNQTYAFARLRKLPLESDRQILSALNHFGNVASCSEDEKKEAFYKILSHADKFKICTMGFKTKYGQYL